MLSPEVANLSIAQQPILGLDAWQPLLDLLRPYLPRIDHDMLFQRNHEKQEKGGGCGATDARRSLAQREAEDWPGTPSPRTDAEVDGTNDDSDPRSHDT